MTDNSKLVDIISSVYDTILNPDAWVLAGQRIRERYHSVYSGLYVYDVRTSALVHDAIYGADETFSHLYASEFCFMDPYREAEEFAAANPGIPLTDKRFDDIFFSIERNHQQHEYFGAYWHRYDCHHTLGSTIDLPGHLRAGVCLPRSASIGAYTTAEKEDFEHIRHAFHQAMSLSNLIHQLGANAKALEQTIQFINQAVYIVDEKGRILNTNSTGVSQLKSRSILQDIGGRLVASIKSINTELLNAISLACNESISQQSSISRKLIEGPMEILICPLQKEVDFLKYHQPRAVVFLLEGQVSNANVLLGLYDFTAAEKVVLMHALNGKSLNEIAAIRGTSFQTVKTQIRHIYKKSGAKNLKELRTLIASLPLQGIS